MYWTSTSLNQFFPSPCNTIVMPTDLELMHRSMFDFSIRTLVEVVTLHKAT